MKRSILLVAPLLLLAAACGDDDDGGLAGADTWCDLARQVESQNDLFGEADSANPDALEDQMNEAVDLMRSAEAIAPSEIKDDVAKTADGFEQFQDALVEADYNFLDVDLTGLEAVSVELEDASANIEAYNERECGIATDGDDDTGDTTGDGEPSDTLGSGTLRDQLVAQFVTMGMTEEQAACVIDKIDFNEITSDESDPMAYLQMMSECGVDITQFGGG